MSDQKKSGGEAWPQGVKDDSELKRHGDRITEYERTDEEAERLEKSQTPGGDA